MKLNLEKDFFVKRVLPHLIAIAVFYLVAALYCKPALEGKVLQTTDISSWEGSIQNSKEYAARHGGKMPLWTNNVFSGMPTFQIGGVGGSKFVWFFHQVLTSFLPAPIQFFFLASICFYIFCMCFRIKPWIAILGSLAYAYATYNPIIINAGHATKMWAIAYMPALLGSIGLILNKKYWLGAVLTALFTGLIISVNHLQIVYYLFIAVGFMCVSYAVHYVLQKDFKALAIAPILIAVAVGIGVLVNAEGMLGTYEYQKYTIRGGPSELTDTTKNAKNAANGLTKDYAMSYSMFKSEPLVMLFPKMFGGSSDAEEVSSEDSKAIEVLSSMPAEMQNQLRPSYYWGGLIDPISVGTSGPPYVGAFLIFLAIFGFYVIDNKHRWWLLAAILFTCMLSWGSYFDALNGWLYKNLPFYNKFRAPSMIIVVPTLLLGVAAMLGMQKAWDESDKSRLLKPLLYASATAALLLVIGLLLYFGFNYKSANDIAMMKQVTESGNVQVIDLIKDYINGLVSDRKGLFLSSIGRAFLFFALAALLIYVWLKNQLSSTIVVAIAVLLVLTDLMTVNKTYMKEENYVTNEDDSGALEPNAVDKAILADKNNYRVFNIVGNAFNENYTSYSHKSIGGYHPAKLRIYQDLIERQLNKFNVGVLSMLNVGYTIKKEGKVTKEYQPIPNAAGSAWFVPKVEFVKNADAEMAALDSIQPKQVAYVREEWKDKVITDAIADTAANIKLIQNDNDYIEYESNSSKNQFAVFSEIYYPAGWKAFIDGKETPIVRTNYVLRGLSVPAGKHKIEFKFAPELHAKGKKYAGIANIALMLLMASLIGYLYLNYFKNKA